MIGGGSVKAKDSTFKNGVNVKDIYGKLPMELIDPEVFEIMALSTQYGLNKYGIENRGNYRRGPIDLFFGAMLRHYHMHISGEIIDSDSGLPHLYHMAWNAMAAAIICKDDIDGL